LRDIRSEKDPQIAAVVKVIASVSPDILLINGFDYDLNGIALAAFTDRLQNAGASYPYHFALRPNTGLRTGLDLDGDGRTETPRDSQGYGVFSGQNGMAIISKLPIIADNALDFSAMRWLDLPGAHLPQRGGKPFPSVEAQAIQRLSTTGHWVVPVRLAGGTILRVLAFHATPPVFDGPEDRNGLRNADEIRFWQVYLNGGLQAQSPEPPFVILGDANLDPIDGQGRHEAIVSLLQDTRLQDPKPTSEGGIIASRQQAGVNLSHRGDPAMDTSDFPDSPGPGNLRLDYVLPSADLRVTGAGVFWPPEDGDVAKASRHRLVWVDVVVDR